MWRGNCIAVWVWGVRNVLDLDCFWMGWNVCMLDTSGTRRVGPKVIVVSEKCLIMLLFFLIAPKCVYLVGILALSFFFLIPRNKLQSFKSNVVSKNPPFSTS